MKLPVMTQHLFSLTRLCCNMWYLVALPVWFCALLLPYAVFRYFGWIRWDVPGLGRLMRRNDTAMILDSLALAAGQNRPLGEAFRSLAESYPKESVRQRLGLAAAALDAGGDWCQCLYNQGLIRRADLGVLQAAQRVGNLPWALREMADSNRRRFLYRAQALVQMIFPLVVIFFGLIVMFVVVAMFLPLITLIWSLA
jgi:type II secretory pathway component PulF